ncbi:MAG TPA: type II toxin-antitoxin system RelE/ParE family toxin [Polyangia bacterium]
MEFDRQASRELDDLDGQVARRILKFLNERLAQLEDPRSIGESLRGPLWGEYWKYRVGDYRIIANIEDRLIRILVVRIGNRREVYR